MNSKFDNFISLFQAAHPQLESWNDERFQKEEIGYKLKASKKFRELLGRDALEELIQKREFEEAIQRFASVGASSYLIFNSVPRAGDLSALHVEGTDKGALVRALFQLLYVDAPRADRIDAFVRFLQRYELPVKWAFVTLWLFLNDPHGELLVRPSMGRHFLKSIGEGERWEPNPSGQAYEAFLALAEELRVELRERFGDATMLHTHGVIYVAYARHRDEEKKKKENTAKQDAAGANAGKDVPNDDDSSDALAPEFVWLFGDRQTANVAFDLLAYACEQLNIRDENSPLAVITWTRKGRSRRLRLDYGSALVLSLEGQRNGLERIVLATRLMSAPTYSLFSVQENFSDEGPSSGYALAAAQVSNLESTVEDVRELITNEFPPLVDAFFGWTGSPFRRHNNEALFRAVFDQSWREALLVNGFEAAPESSDAPFTRNTFEVLSRLAENPVIDTYTEHKDAFEQHVKKPFQEVFKKAVVRLPETLLKTMEHEHKLFSRINKNDFGKGGIFPYYWGAMYPKGGKRTEDPQLSLWINESHFRIGFHIGLYGGPARERFTRNVQRYVTQLPRLFASTTGDAGWSFGPVEESETEITWEQFFRNPNAYDTSAVVDLDAATVVQRSEEDIIELIADTWRLLYPLVLLATREDPLNEIKDYMGGDQETEDGDGPGVLHENYPLAQLVEDTGIDESLVSHWLAALERKKQIVLYGPPGTGKTFVAQRIARHILGGTNGLTETVQFHPAYAYEDFMEGLRPERTAEGQIDYRIRNGLFVRFCTEAMRTKDLCVLIIDEINRANLARVFGELMYLLEYREESVLLPSGQQFRIPENVRIIGTMNTADRSIALVDHALRRRFAFLRLQPDYELLRRYHARLGRNVDGLVETLREINQAIYDENYAVGISFFLHPELPDHLELIWRTEITPYLEEYFFDQTATAARFAWERVSAKMQSSG